MLVDDSIFSIESTNQFVPACPHVHVSEEATVASEWLVVSRISMQYIFHRSLKSVIC